MVRQAVRAPTVLELLAMLVCFACVGMHGGAQAAEGPPPDAAEVCEREDDDELGSAPPEQQQYRETSDAPPKSKRKVLEPDEGKQAVPGALTVTGLALVFAPPLAEAPRGDIDVRVAPLFQSSVSPRGPPSSAR